MPQRPSQDPGFLTKTSLLQLAYGVWVSLTMVVIGLAFGFTAVAIPQLALADSHIHVTISDQSWITSVLTLLSPLGCVITGYLVDKIGRRIVLIFCHLPVVVGWLCTAIATNANSLIIARIITGFGLGMILVAPRPYLSELALPNMRGVIGTFHNLALSIGILIQAGLGSFCKWQTLCYISMVYSLILMFSNYLLPETPYYLLMTSTIDRAEASLRKFRSADYNIEAEMEELKRFKLENNIRRLTWREKVKALFNRSSYIPFFVILVYFMFTQASGISVMTMWTVEMLQRSKCSVDARTGNIILSVTRLLSAVFTSIIIFRVGRRPLALMSSLGVGFTYAIIGAYIIYTKGPTVFPLFCYIASIVFSSLGYYTLPVIIMSELYPLQVRGILGGFSTSLNYFLIFAVNKLYPHLTQSIGFPYAMITFGSFSLLGFVFLYMFLPETKNLKLQEIEEYYNKRRSVLERKITRLPEPSHNTDKYKTDNESTQQGITDKKDIGSISMQK